MERSEVKFWTFHKHNPEVFDKLVEFCLQAAHSGHKHFGIRAAWERLRWWTVIETDYDPDWGPDYKLPNDLTPYYARLIMKKVPELKGFFRTRSVGIRRKERRAASTEDEDSIQSYADREKGVAGVNAEVERGFHD